jgi:hypothetical protein
MKLGTYVLQITTFMQSYMQSYMYFKLLHSVLYAIICWGFIWMEAASNVLKLSCSDKFLPTAQP